MLENSGFFCVDPDDEEYTKRKLERPVAPAMPCKRMDTQHPSIVKATAKSRIGNVKEIQTMCDCIVESHASTRQRAEFLQSKIHEDRNAVNVAFSIWYTSLFRCHKR